MQERPKAGGEQIQNQERIGFDFGRVRMMFAHADTELRLNQLSTQLENTEIEMDDTTWTSKTVRGENHQKVIIGTEKLPENIEQAFAWGVETKEDEIVLKVAHELSHIFQKTEDLENQLVSFLSGNNNISEKAIPYIELYSLLSGLGSLTGLSDMSIYHEQSEVERERVTAGLAININILEDITELIAAYSLGDEYFNFRIDAAPISDQNKQNVSRHIVDIFHAHLK